MIILSSYPPLMGFVGIMFTFSHFLRSSTFSYNCRCEYNNSSLRRAVYDLSSWICNLFVDNFGLVTPLIFSCVFLYS